MVDIGSSRVLSCFASQLTNNMEGTSENNGSADVSREQTKKKAKKVFIFWLYCQLFWQEE